MPLRIKRLKQLDVEKKRRKMLVTDLSRDKVLLQAVIFWATSMGTTPNLAVHDSSLIAQCVPGQS